MGGLVRGLSVIRKTRVVGMGKVWAVKKGEVYDLHSGILTFCSAASIKVYNRSTYLGMIMIHKGLEDSSITRSNLQKALSILDPRRPRFRFVVTDIRKPGGWCSSKVDIRIKEIYLNSNPGQRVIQENCTLSALYDIIASNSFDNTQSRNDLENMVVEDTSGLEVSVCAQGNITATPPAPSYWSQFTKFIGWS